MGHDGATLLSATRLGLSRLLRRHDQGSTTNGKDGSIVGIAATDTAPHPGYKDTSALVEIG